MPLTIRKIKGVATDSYPDSCYTVLEKETLVDIIAIVLLLSYSQFSCLATGFTPCIQNYIFMFLNILAVRFYVIAAAPYLKRASISIYLCLYIWQMSCVRTWIVLFIVFHHPITIRSFISQADSRKRYGNEYAM